MSYRTVTIAATAALLALAQSALAAEPTAGLPAQCVTTDGSQPFCLAAYEFLERNYLFASPNAVNVNDKRAPLVFEGQVGAHLPLWGAALDSADPRTELHHEVRIIFTFLTLFRMTGSDSAPVVSPSYMPKLRVQWLARRVFTHQDGSPARDLRFGATLDVFSHHSNGQDGCTYRTATPRTDGECAVRGPDVIGLDERNGSFGTNWVGLTLHGRHSWGARVDSNKFSLLASSGLQYHHNVPAGGLTSAASSDLRRLYGAWHAFGELEARYDIDNKPRTWAGYLYGRARYEWASGGSDPLLPSITAAHESALMEIGWTCTRLLGLGLFARVVTGRDYYNIEFTQRATRIQLGFAFDTTGVTPSIGL